MTIQIIETLSLRKNIVKQTVPQAYQSRAYFNWQIVIRTRTASEYK
jgi:hypothetical protein